jgi:hypothetical protein
MIKSPERLIGALVLIAGLTACSGESSAPGNGSQVSFNMATRAAPTSGPAPMATPDTVNDGTNVLVLTKVEMVLSDIKFERQNEEACDSVETEANHDDCEEFESGPVLIDLPLGVGATHEFTVTADTGTFDEIKLKIHKPEDGGDATDQAFIAQNPAFANVSIRVTGTFNGVDFVFTTDLSAEQKISISPPLVVGSQTAVAVTLKVDISTWFLNGAVAIDPSLALKGQPLEGLVKSNIEASLHAFHDDDRDGRSDD